MFKKRYDNYIPVPKPQLIQGFLDGLRPVKRLTVSQWADQYRYLPPLGAEPGLWRTERTPYLREIMDCLSATSPYEKVVFMKGAQIGATEAGNNWIGYVIDNNPSVMLVVMPTDGTMLRNSKARIQPMIDATPVLSAKIMPSRKKDAVGAMSNTLMQKDYAGGSLIMGGANSPASLRSIAARYVFLDEVDEYPKDVEGQGDPIELARARTRSFGNSKIYIVSTPTIKNHSTIESEFEQTDKRYYFVPCPHCNHKQHLVWEQLRWEKGKPDTVHYECESCAGAILNHHKFQFLPKGEWIATAPENGGGKVAGFHLNALYSPFAGYTWAHAVADYEAALKNPNKMKAFQNTVLGLTFEEKGDVPDWEALFRARERYDVGSLPDGVVLITAGADVQKDRIEVEIVGWGKNRESWSIDYRVFMGQTNERAVWDELAKLVTETWEREDGSVIPMGFLCVDSGYNTSYVYDFCRRFDKSRVMPIRGQESQATMLSTPRGVDYSMSGKKIGRIEVLNIGVSLIKSEIYGFLKLGINPETGEIPFGYCHFPQYDPEYFKGLTAEKLEEKTDRKGNVRYEWVRHYKRNEPLDCRVYARAAAERLGLSRYTDDQLEQLGKLYAKKVQQASANTTTKVRKKKDSSFW